MIEFVAGNGLRYNDLFEKQSHPMGGFVASHEM